MEHLFLLTIYYWHDLPPIIWLYSIIQSRGFTIISSENHTILLLIYLAYPICGRVNDLLLSLPTSDYHYSFNYCSPRHIISSFTQGPLGTLGSVTIMHLLTRTLSYWFQSLSDKLLFTRKHWVQKHLFESINNWCTEIPQDFNINSFSPQSKEIASTLTANVWHLLIANHKINSVRK